MHYTGQEIEIIYTTKSKITNNHRSLNDKKYFLFLREFLVGFRRQSFSEKKNVFVRYSPFYKTLAKSRLQMHWVFVRFFEMGDRLHFAVHVEMFISNNM